MASVSVVGQQPGPHGLDSEPQVLLFRNKRRSSWEKMMLARSGVDAANEESRSHRLRTRMPAGGCGAAAELCAQDGKPGRAAPRRTGQPPSCDPNQNTGCRRLMGVCVMSDTPRGAHRHRDGDARSRQQRSDAIPLERLTQGKTGVVRLARTEPPRREAWSIFPREMDPRVRPERGEGHRFRSRPVKQDWCDACSRQMTAQGLKCQNCSYTCHLECESHVKLDCIQKDRGTGDSPDPAGRNPSSSTAAPRCKMSY